MKPSAILCADLHFRDDQPVCRTDDFRIAQIKKMSWLKDLQQELNVPVYCSGDYFHHWKPSPWLLSACIVYMPFVYTIPGNHDLPNHNLDLIEKSGLWTLQKAGKVEIWPCPLGKVCDPNIEGIRLGLIHKLINHPQSDTTASSIMNKFKDYDLILSGDNHETFVEHKKERMLVNPGSFSRQTAAQAEHKPCVFLWYAEGRYVEKVELPIEAGVVSRDHLERGEERKNRMDAFVENLNEGFGGEINFVDNLTSYFDKNREKKSVQNMCWESVEEE